MMATDLEEIAESMIRKLMETLVIMETNVNTCEEMVSNLVQRQNQRNAGSVAQTLIPDSGTVENLHKQCESLCDVENVGSEVCQNEAESETAEGSKSSNKRGLSEVLEEKNENFEQYQGENSVKRQKLDF